MEQPKNPEELSEKYLDQQENDVDYVLNSDPGIRAAVVAVSVGTGLNLLELIYRHGLDKGYGTAELTIASGLVILGVGLAAKKFYDVKKRINKDGKL